MKTFSKEQLDIILKALLDYDDQICNPCNDALQNNINELITYFRKELNS